MHIYAIGDIHGHLDLLRHQHHLIGVDAVLHGAAPVVHLGDLVDRGPDSQGVVEYLRQGVAAGRDWVVLKGNHDRLCTQFLNDPTHHDSGLSSDMSWLHPKIGGAATLASYGIRNAADRRLGKVHVEAVAALPREHRQFLETRPTSFSHGSAVFVHAGIRPGIDLANQAEVDLVWIRREFLDDMRDHGALIVHGHTAIPTPTHYGNRLNIDSGAAYGGPLSTVVIDGDAVFHLTDTGRVRLLPR